MSQELESDSQDLMTSGADIIINVLGTLALLFYVVHRFFKIKQDFREETPYIKFYVPSALCCVMVFITGIYFMVYPLIVSSLVEFVGSFVLIVYYYIHRVNRLSL